ncbi:hypothetical protein M409DRAFT_20036 [Zasmidium cellare ATCC 36951]|uniref:Uncharacterized protein n=1 Tax=Zasmidium cellare ATCC 36951 TaxID=1080233 RepID=A0A6A6CUX8_ZASCE|nr:uncharacterized protein M409DRAFT_20036 [Zasmidium cellare ATCC 36951]KAF2169622.1 hypothetical protein M409DRAFT_20036 [Zasmidium cellare ATCC 36951]
MAPPLTTAVQPKLQPIVKNTASSSKSKPKPKTTFLSLPQGLRDHVYSYLPFQAKQRICIVHSIGRHDEVLELAMRLSQTCRTVSKDMQQEFWACNKFYWYVKPGAEPGKFRGPWTAATVARIRDLEMALVGCFWVSGRRYVGWIHLVEEDGVWVARLLSRNRGQGGPGVYASDEEKAKWDKRANAIRDKMEAKAKPYLAQAELELNKRGCITVKVLQILDDMRIPPIQSSWR